MVDLHEETISKLLITNDSHSLHIAADEEARIMIACEHAADEWIKAEEQAAKNNLSEEISQKKEKLNEEIHQKKKEYNNLKTSVAANRCKIAVAKQGAEMIAALHNIMMAPKAKNAEKAEKKKLQKIIESYCGALNEYQQFLQRVEGVAPETWNTARGWSLVADEWRKNRKSIEELERKVMAKMKFIDDVKTEEDEKKDYNMRAPSNRHLDREEEEENEKEEARFGNKEEEEANRTSKIMFADFLESFQEENQTLANQFSKDINKLILDMAAGNKVK
jgi:hypothetical protein